jgi:integrase
MTNPLPHNAATLPAILDYLAASHRYGIRNKCLYRLRLVLPYKDITDLRVGNIFRRDGSIVSDIVGDGWTLPVDRDLAVDLLNYIRERYQRYDLVNLVFIRGSDYLFSTQKSSSFSPGWLAQLYTHLDRSIRHYFSSLERPTKKH